MPPEKSPDKQLQQLTPQQRQYLESLLQEVINADLPGNEFFIAQILQALNGGVVPNGHLKPDAD